MDALRDVTTTQTDSIVRRGTSEEGRFVSGTLLGGRYRIIGILGEGGMGEVYRATDLALGQSVALKFLREAAAKNDRLLERFQGEVRVARQVSHPNVCRVYDIGEVDGIPFLSMEYVDGEDLSTLLRRIGRLPAAKATEIARKICAGLQAAHDKGVIHRDLKPQNIMLNKKGEVMILDFGLAAIADQLSGPEARNGTPAYMSPEQLKGTEVTAKSDIYALGLVLYELFSGVRPYKAGTVQELIALQESARPSSVSSLVADVDPAVERALLRCLDPNPARRPGSALAVAAALPGGDPLAAALAAGETPSPEMVAAAGATEGLALKYSIPCLAAILLCLIALPWVRQQQHAIHRAPTEFPPDVLKQKAREMAVRFGYNQKPADTAVRLFERPLLLRHLQTLPERAWDRWLAAEGPGLVQYREALVPLAAMPRGTVTETNPAPIAPGMVQIETDSQGRLRGFRGVPYAAAPTGPALATEEIFRAAELDYSKFAPVPPLDSPTVPAEQFQAWRGSHPGIPDTVLVVQIGSWKGQVTEVKIRWPWMKDGTGELASPLQRTISLVGLAIGTFFVLLLSRRNWKSGRIDRRGALRIAILAGLLVVLTWLSNAHFVPTTSFVSMIFDILAQGLFFGAILWLVYLAIEPSLRARWPQSIVTWNRLLAGQWKDALVWSHVLIGGAAGLLLMMAVLAYENLRLGIQGPGIGGWDAELLGTRQWFGKICDLLVGSLQAGLLLFLVMSGLRTLLRRDWIAALVMALIFAGQASGTSQPSEWATTYATYVVLFSALSFLMLRLGLIAIIAAMFFFNCSNSLVLGLDWNVWYAPTAFATFFLILSISVLAFWRSLGARNLIEFPDDVAR